MNNRRLWIVISVVVCGLFLLLLGPMDIFAHGFFGEQVEMEQIADIDKLGMIHVDDEKCVISFSPQKNHFAGMELYLVDHVRENGGTMIMTIEDKDGKQIDSIEIDLGKINNSTWYKVYINASLRKHEQYTARFKVFDTDTVPAFLLVDQNYLGDETITGNILINYAYKQSTFSFQEKVMLSMLILAVLSIMLYLLTSLPIHRRCLAFCSLFLILTTGMAWNYMYNSFDNKNTRFINFQSDSETLVSGAIYAEQDGVFQLNGYGLGRYYNLRGCWTTYGLEYLTDDTWLCGYGRTIPAIVVNASGNVRSIVADGKYIKFGNGEEYRITGTVDYGSNIVINFDAERPLSQARNGNLDKITFYDENKQPIPKSVIYVYGSQYGLQGKIFRHMSRYMSQDEVITNLNLVCSLATAAVFVLIVLLLAIKVNPLFAGCFYITCALSPWVVNFARNLYWVEFTWFIPMLVGLVCSIKIESVKWRIGCYIATFISITGKCLCGYEYISVIMMGLVAFMVVDLLLAIIKRDNKKMRLLFKSTFVIGVVALIGFAIAICVHAWIRSDGDLIVGIQRIIKEDVLRRTNGADLNNFGTEYWPSMNASVWEVFSKYFHFTTEIIAGVPGNLFPALCITPIAFFVYDFRKKMVDWQSVFMYVFFFLASISWFCLAKSHSYIHGHMNYVLWYFGFIQTCIYVIVSRFVNTFSVRKNEEDC